MNGSRSVPLTAISTYLPRGRLTAGADTGLSGMESVPPARPVAGHDEDVVSMAVEAAGCSLASGSAPARLLLVTSRPPYERKTNAAFVHAALGLDPLTTSCADVTGGESALAAAVEHCQPSGGLVVLSDIVVGRPGSPQEAQGADGAVALRFGGEGPELASVEAVRSLPSTDLTRWRLPGEGTDRVWRGRYSGHALQAAGATVAADLLADGEGVDVVAVAADDPRLAKTLAGPIGGRPVVQPEGGGGHAGLAHAGRVLHAALREAAPGERILLLVVGDGASGFLLRRGPAPIGSVPEQGTRRVPYTEYLVWRGLLERDLSGRPEPAAPAAPAIARNPEWKYGLVAARCGRCGTVLVPPGRVCPQCGAVDSAERHELARRRGRIATFTVDHLVSGVARPVCSAVVDFDGGGRMECEVTDVLPEELAVGLPVRMVFRRAFQVDGISNYVWKSTLVREESA